MESTSCSKSFLSGYGSDTIATVPTVPSSIAGATVVDFSRIVPGRTFRDQSRCVEKLIPSLEAYCIGGCLE
jgi:hypothetical protein